MSRPLFQVDAFADAPFTGNPAAVCLLDEHAPEPPATWMQQVAAEMNLAETAFVRPREDGDFDLRWFTPLAEVRLCGHATLASAHVLWEEGRLPLKETARFHTLSGVLQAEREGAEDGAITLDFPATPTAPTPPPDGLLGALGLSDRPVETDGEDYLIEVESEAALRTLRPDMGLLGEVEARGVIVTTRAETEDADIVSRFFAPRVGVPEDPVTGSAHCRLAPYWAERLGSTILRAVQASARGGRLRVELRGDRVRLTGGAVTVLRGELLA